MTKSVRQPSTDVIALSLATVLMFKVLSVMWCLVSVSVKMERREIIVLKVAAITHLGQTVSEIVAVSLRIRRAVIRQQGCVTARQGGPGVAVKKGVIYSIMGMDVPKTALVTRQKCVIMKMDHVLQHKYASPQIHRIAFLRIT